MSKHNKANKNNYVQAGRLTPDELAREQAKQRQAAPRASEERFKGPAEPPRGPADPDRQDEREGSE